MRKPKIILLQLAAANGTHNFWWSTITDGRAHFVAGIQTNRFDLATRGFQQVISNQFVNWISQFFDFTVYFTTFWNKFSWKITIQLSENSQKCLNNSKIWENCAFWMPKNQKATKRSVHFVNDLAWFFTSIDQRITNDWHFHSSKEKGKQILNFFVVFTNWIFDFILDPIECCVLSAIYP